MLGSSTYLEKVFWYITDGHSANNGYTVNRVSATTLEEARKKIERVHREFRIFMVEEARDRVSRLIDRKKIKWDC